LVEVGGALSVKQGWIENIPGAVCGTMNKNGAVSSS